MAKDSIRDFSATAGSNTDIQSVNIDENCPASGINNAIRELMVDLKNVSTGAVNLETPAADQLNVDNIRIDGNTISSTDTNGNVNIDPAGTGETVIDSSVRITKTSGAPTLLLTDNDTNGDGTIDASDGNLRFYSDNDQEIASSLMAFYVDGAEAMRIDSSGKVIIGVANLLAGGSAYTNEGITLHPGSDTVFHRDGGSVVDFSRGTDDGQIVRFIQDNSVQGYISTPFDTSLGIFGPGGNGAGFVFQNNDEINPGRNGSRVDDAISLGNGTFRYDDLFAANGTIQTSDQNEKQQIASLTSAEITAAKAISKLFKTYKWKSKVAAKGDAARTHSGVIAQEVQAAMSDAGLDAADYAFWCSDTWWETSTDVAAVEADEEAGIEARDAYTRIDTYHTADEAPEGATQRTRLGIRYPELLAFVGAATEQRLADIETRLTALEA